METDNKDEETKYIDYKRLRTLHEGFAFLETIGTRANPADVNILVTFGQSKQCLPMTTEALRQLRKINKQREELIEQILWQTDEK